MKQNSDKPLINKIMHFIFPQTESFQSRLDEDISNKIAKLGLVISLLIILFELTNLILIGLLNKVTLPEETRNIYLGMYILLLVISLIFFIRCIRYLIVSKKIKNIYLIKEQNLFAGIVLFWSTIITILDQSTTTDVSVYICAVLSIAAITYLKPLYTILMFGCNHILLLTCFTIFQQGSVNNMGSYTNTSIITILAMVTSISRYKNKYTDFKNHIIITQQNEKINFINKQLNAKTITDDLTGLYNRRYMNETLPILLEQCRIENGLLTAIMIDIDDFKLYNDYYGHPAGDDCLRQVSKAIKTTINPYTDCVIRYGGEEFLIALDNFDKERTDQIARKVLTAIRQLYIPTVTKTKFVTVSIGFYCDTVDISQKIEDFIRCADEALYHSKSTGKDKVTCY